jgi:ankyrin repeat protein
VKELGVNINKAVNGGSTPLQMAIATNNLDLLRCPVEECGADINQADNDGNTPLIIAAQRGNLDALQYLEKHGANVYEPNMKGVTPLYIAAQNGHLDVLKFLVDEFGADINKGPLEGRTPLFAASKNQRNEVVRWLLKKGANAQTKYKEFGTPADVSKDFGAPAEQTAYIEARTHCANPGCSGAGRKKCVNCLEVFFCSKECQVAVWLAHKADCRRHVEGKGGKGKPN